MASSHVGDLHRGLCILFDKGTCLAQIPEQERVSRFSSSHWVRKSDNPRQNLHGCGKKQPAEAPKQPFHHVLSSRWRDWQMPNLRTYVRLASSLAIGMSDAHFWTTNTPNTQIVTITLLLPLPVYPIWVANHVSSRAPGCMCGTKPATKTVRERRLSSASVETHLHPVRAER